MHPRNDPNLDRLEQITLRLGSLVDELMLVGGTAAGLLVTDPGAEPVRPTSDVDVVVEVSTLAGLDAFGARLRRCGFHEGKREGDPICRWRHGELILDVLPLDESVLGFSNRWYRSAFACTVGITLPSGAEIRHIDGPHFVATKLEAYGNRGVGDPSTSHDLEDIVRVVDGRPTLPGEVLTSDVALRTFLAERMRGPLEDRFFLEALSTYFRNEGDARAAIVLARLRGLAAGP